MDGETIGDQLMSKADQGVLRMYQGFSLRAIKTLITSCKTNQNGNDFRFEAKSEECSHADGSTRQY
jgi:hypothetical protein